MSAVGARLALLLGAVLLVSGCAAGSGAASSGGAPSAPSSASPTMAPGSEAPPASILTLADGPITPGRYVVMPPEVGWAECASWVPECPPEPPQARSLQLEITIPPGWEAGADATIIVPSQGSTEGPDGAGLEIGWTTPTAGLHSDPCQSAPHLEPDIRPGPTVGEFVDAVLAHLSPFVGEPVDVELGGYRGTFFQLTVPSEILTCRDWRPFEPGIYAQGPDNVWSIWVIDVDSFRMIVLTEEFSDTPAKVRADLRAMVESIRFVP